MEKFLYDWCLEDSSGSAPDRDSGIPSDVAFLCFLVRFALFFEPRRSLRQRSPRLGQLGFPPKLLQRFLRGFVVATARGLVTAPASVCRACGSASVYVGAREQMIWMNRIFARVMSGFVMREEVRLQAAAAARIAGRSGIIAAAGSGDVADVLSYLITHTGWANERR